MKFNRNTMPLARVLSIPFFAALLISITTGCQKNSLSVPIKKISPSISFGGEAVAGEAVLGHVSDFIVSSKNEIVALDVSAAQIVFFTEQGSMIKRVGRKGQGPGEFLQPFHIGQAHDTLFVWDPRNRRLASLTTEADFIRTVTPDPSFGYRAMAFNPHGGFYCGTEGFRNSSLIQAYSAQARQTKSFAQLESAEIEVYDFNETKNYTKRRQIPPAEKNKILLCYTADDNILALHQALPLLKKYSADGTLLLQQTLESPVFLQNETAFYTANDSLPNNQFQPLRFWADVTPDNAGGAYALLYSNTSMIIHHYDAAGNVLEYLHGPDEAISLIYFYNGSIWAYSRDSGTFLKFIL